MKGTTKEESIKDWCSNIFPIAILPKDTHKCFRSCTSVYTIDWQITKLFERLLCAGGGGGQTCNLLVLFIFSFKCSALDSLGYCAPHHNTTHIIAIDLFLNNNSFCSSTSNHNL